LLEKVLVTREERISNCVADLDLLGDSNTGRERSGKGSVGGAGAWTRGMARLPMLGTGRTPRSQSPTMGGGAGGRRRHGGGRRQHWRLQRKFERRGGTRRGRAPDRCCDTIAGDAADGMGADRRRFIQMDVGHFRPNTEIRG
jgi:hypothetical protein